MTRDLYILDSIITIGTEKMEQSLFSESGRYVSEEALLLDEMIYCYVDDEILNKPTEEIIHYIKRFIDPEFPCILNNI